MPTKMLPSIQPTAPALREHAQKRLDMLTKPQGSLGRLEEIAAKLFCIQQGTFPIAAGPACMYTFAADHGVVEEGIAITPQHVTMQMSMNMLRGGAGISVLCRAAGADFFLVDVGIKGELPPHPKLIQAKIAHATANMTKGPAMSRAECETALKIGIRMADEAALRGVRVLGTGEMGIGNTTASTALFCAYLGLPISLMTGIGAGAPVKGVQHKCAVIEKALAVNKDAVTSGDAIAILAALGGLEIAGMAGLILGAAANSQAVVIDGFIATAAYCAAYRMAPAVRDYCFFSHGSAEAGHKKALEKLHEEPLLDLNLRLGEGTGAALGFSLLASAAAIFNEMATFEEGNITI